MLEPKQIARFALFFVLSFGALMGSRLWVADAYASLFRLGGNIAFVRFWLRPDGSVRFLDLRLPEAELFRQIDRCTDGTLPAQYTPPRVQGVKDTLMILKHRKVPGTFGTRRTSSRMIGYTPTAFMIALFVATPTTWRRRGWGMVWGLLGIHLFIFVRVSIDLLYDGFAGAKPYALFHPGEFLSGLVHGAKELVVDNPTVYLGVSIVLWLLICFLTGSLSAFRPLPEGEDGEPAHGHSSR